MRPTTTACSSFLCPAPHLLQWIASEKQFFGRPGSDYDWEANNADEVREGNAAKAAAQHAGDSQQCHLGAGKSGTPLPCACDALHCPVPPTARWCWGASHHAFRDCLQPSACLTSLHTSPLSRPPQKFEQYERANSTIQELSKKVRPCPALLA